MNALKYPKTRSVEKSFLIFALLKKLSMPIFCSYLLCLTFSLQAQRDSLRAPRYSKNTKIIWNKPNPLETGKNVFAADQEVYDIKLTALSNQKLQAKDIKIYINNKSLDGSKFEEGELRVVKRQKEYQHLYKGKILLEQGINRIEVEVTDEAGLVKTYPIEIHYEPKRINLHILSIGPKHNNLQFTSKDADDFAKAFNNQEDRLFKKIFTYKHTKAENTDPTSLRESFHRLKLLYESEIEEKINKDDLLIIFISSHGQKEGNRFKIQTSGYKAMFSNLYTIDYEEDIINYLKEVKCKKLLFIDACHSGAAYAEAGSKSIAEEDMSQALFTLLNADPGLTTITSCQKYEKSYEDPVWKNGAFTEAILAAFANRQFKGLVPDANGNKIIELGELKNYIQAYVPFLVKTQKPKAGTQVPHITTSQLTMSLPIYALDTYEHRNFKITAQGKGRIQTEEFRSLPQNTNTTASTNTNYTQEKTNIPAAMRDSDGDGVSDELDHCPDHKGILSNNGCPATKSMPKGPMKGMINDDRDGQLYTWARMKDGKKWMTQNVSIPMKKESWCYDDKKKNCKTTGRLYTWNAAQKVCPKGWRLPSIRDWENLINHYGGKKAAYQALLNNNELNIQLSGLRTSDNSFCCFGEFGNYWTAESSIARATYIDFNSPFGMVNEETHDKNTALSCRCIQE